MNYHTPASFREASDIALGCDGTTRFLAGGTDVLVQLRADTVQPDDLIDVKHIPGTREMNRTEGGAWRIGVAVAGAEMSENADLCADYPGVTEAMDLIGSQQVQGRATLVGNLCNGSPAADSVPALFAVGAMVGVTGKEGTREMMVSDVPVGPGRTALEKGDVISSVILPPKPANSGDAYLRFIPRTEMDIAVVGCGVQIELDGDTVTAARVALGAVAPTVLLVEDAANAIIGTTLDDAALAALGQAAEAACNPITDKRGTIEFRTEVAGVLARRAAKIAYDRAKGAAS